MTAVWRALQTDGPRGVFPRSTRGRPNRPHAPAEPPGPLVPDRNFRARGVRFLRPRSRLHISARPPCRPPLVRLRGVRGDQCSLRFQGTRMIYRILIGCGIGPDAANVYVSNRSFPCRMRFSRKLRGREAEGLASAAG